MIPAPKLIKRTDEGILIVWRDDHQAVYSYGYLRKKCPCAECRKNPPRVVEADDPFKLIDDEPIFAETAELVGNYAVQFFWNDGHRHGIYSFDYLRSNCPCPPCSGEEQAIQASEKGQKEKQMR